MTYLIRKGNQCLAHGKLFSKHHNLDEKNRGSVTSNYSLGKGKNTLCQTKLPRETCAHKGIDFKNISFQ